MYVPEANVLLDMFTTLLLFVQLFVADAKKLLTVGPEALIVIDAVLPENELMVHPLLITAPEIVTVVVPTVLSAFVINEPVPFINRTSEEPSELEFEPENA